MDGGECRNSSVDALGADRELHAWVERQLRAPLDAEALLAGELERQALAAG